MNLLETDDTKHLELGNRYLILFRCTYIHLCFKIKLNININYTLIINSIRLLLLLLYNHNNYKRYLEFGYKKVVIKYLCLFILFHVLFNHVIILKYRINKILNLMIFYYYCYFYQ